jgi:hypothetical protein
MRQPVVVLGSVLQQPVVVLGIVLGLGAGHGAVAQVSPADRDLLEGNASTIYPLGRAGARVQQLHGDVPGPRLLLGHAYRRDAVSRRDLVEGFQSEVEVLVSTTGLTPVQMLPLFASNHGPSPQTVLLRRWVSFPATSRPPVDPSPAWQLVIPYLAPYSYAGAGSLCVDVLVFGNVVGARRNLNFTPEIDAHEAFPDRRNVQPGVPYGAGCATFDLTLIQRGDRIDLQLALRDALPLARSWLLVGRRPALVRWPGTDCWLLTSGDAVAPMPGPTDERGAWSMTSGGLPALAPGLVLYGQMLSHAAASGVVATSDGARVTVPPLGPPLHPAMRLGNGGDPLALSGNLSASVAVVRFF